MANDVVRALLPRGRAFRIAGVLIDALSSVADRIRLEAELAWLDFFPATTRNVSEWQDQFGLDAGLALTDTQRRERLAGVWKATGSLSPKHLQDVLQTAGFDVWVHEWWIPGSVPVSPRDPLTHLSTVGAVAAASSTRCGVANARCGVANARCGSTFSALGYPLVDGVTRSAFLYLATLGDPDLRCGAPGARCGASTGVVDVASSYPIPSAPHVFVYIGGFDFPDLVTVRADRRSELERLVLKHKPAHLWAGMLINYA